MSTAMRIDIGVGGLNTALVRMDRIVSNGKQFEAIMGRMKAASGSGGASSGGGSSTSGGANPLVRLQNAQAALQKAMSSGNAVQVFGAQYQSALAQKAMQRAQTAINGGPGFSQRLMGFIGSTRIGMGGFGGMQMMPLVGRLLSLFGASGPIGIAVTAGAAALSAFVMAVHSAASALNEIRSAKLTSGASGKTMATLNAMGLSPGEASQAAQRFSDLSAHNGYAAYLRSQAGVGQNVGGPYGEQDKAGALEGVLKHIASLSTLEERRKAAMMGELTALMPLIEMYRKHKATIEADASAMAMVNNDQATSAAADFMFQLKRVGDMFQLIGSAIGQAYLGDWAKGLGVLADILRQGAVWIGNNTQATRLFIDSVFPLAGVLDGVMKGFGFLGDVLKFAQGLLKPVTDALQPLFAAFRKLGGAFAGLLGALGGALGKLFLALAQLVTKPVIDLLVIGLKLLTPAITAMADAIPKLYEGIRKFMDSLIDNLPDSLKNSLQGFKLPAWDDLADPLAANTAALNANTQSNHDLAGVFQPGTYGGGQAVRGAVPAKWTRFSLQSDLALASAQRLGAFAMG